MWQTYADIIQTTSWNRIRLGTEGNIRNIDGAVITQREITPYHTSNKTIKPIQMVRERDTSIEILTVI